MGPDDLREFIYPLALFLIEQALLNAAEDDAVGPFDSPVGLWVVHRSKDYLRVQTVTEFSEELRIKLFSVIDGDLSWDPESADDVLPKEFSD